MCDDISSEWGFPIKGSKSSTEIATWDFYVVVSVSSQKEAIETLLMALDLEPPLGETIGSKEEVGEAVRWSWNLATEEVTTTSSLDGSFSPDVSSIESHLTGHLWLSSLGLRRVLPG